MFIQIISFLKMFKFILLLLLLLLLISTDVKCSPTDGIAQS